MVQKKLIKGKDKGDVLLYALSTCVWCKKTRKLLDEIGVEYNLIEVDLIDDIDGKKCVQKEISRWNPDVSFPTIVINNEECICGYDEEKIKEMLG